MIETGTSPQGAGSPRVLQDVSAGIAVWALLTPLALAYAELAGVPPMVSLMSVPAALLGYVALRGSRLLIAGPDAAVCVLSASTVAMAATTGVSPLTLTITLALIVGVIYLVFSLMKMGWIADVIPAPVLKGFIEGVVWVTILKQVDDLLGLQFTASPGGTWERIVAIGNSLPTLHVPTMLFGALSLVSLVLLKRFAPRVPGPFIVLIAAGVAVAVLGLGGAGGVAVLGQIETDGLSLGFPDADLYPATLMALAPGALAIVVLGYTKSVGALSYAAAQAQEPIDPNRELRAIGGANLFAGLGGGYAVAGSLSATAVNVNAGGRSPLSSITAAAMSLLVVGFFTPLLASLPLAALAAIIVHVMLGLSDPRGFRMLWGQRRFEFALAAAVFVAVLLFDVMVGVSTGVVIALFALGRHVHSPPCAIVGRTAGGAFVDVDEHAGAREIPGMVIWRQYGPLVFLNARSLEHRLVSLADERKDVEVVVVDATAAAGIDSTAARACMSAARVLRARGIELWVVNPRRRGWALIVNMLEDAKSPLPERFDSLHEAVARYEQRRQAPRSG